MCELANSADCIRSSCSQRKERRSLILKVCTAKYKLYGVFRRAEIHRFQERRFDAVTNRPLKSKLEGILLVLSLHSDGLGIKGQFHWHKAPNWFSDHKLYRKHDQPARASFIQISHHGRLLGPPGSPKLSTSSDIIDSSQRVRSAGRDPQKVEVLVKAAESWSWSTSLSGLKIVGGKLQMREQTSSSGSNRLGKSRASVARSRRDRRRC